MIKSKYLNKKFGNWVCIEVGIANVQPKKSKKPGTLNYCYYFENQDYNVTYHTIIKLNSTEATSVYHKKQTIEEILDRRLMKTKNKLPSRDVHYKYLNN